MLLCIVCAEDIWPPDIGLCARSGACSNRTLLLMKQKVTRRDLKVTVEWICIEGRVNKRDGRIIHFIKDSKL